MTMEEQAELRKTLVAVGGLLSNLMPEDDLLKVALDPKRQASAAQMLGTVTLAIDLLKRALELCDSVPHPNGHNRRGDTRAYVLKRLARATEPLLRNVVANQCVAAGASTTTPSVYAAMHSLEAKGKLKFDKRANTVELVKE